MLPATNIGQRLRQARRERGLSIHALSKRSGVSSGTISDIENELRPNPRGQTIEKLADAFGMDTDLKYGIVGGPELMVREGLFQLGLSGRAIAHIEGDIAIWKSIEGIDCSVESDGD